MSDVAKIELKKCYNFQMGRNQCFSYPPAEGDSPWRTGSGFLPNRFLLPLSLARRPGGNFDSPFPERRDSPWRAGRGSSPLISPLVSNTRKNTDRISLTESATQNHDPSKKATESKLGVTIPDVWKINIFEQIVLHFSSIKCQSISPGEYSPFPDFGK